MAKTKIMKCDGNCEHKYQDKKYRKKRLMNQTVKGWRCTVCDKDHRSA